MANKKSVWEKMKDKAGGPLDSAAERADRGNAIWRGVALSQPPVELTGDMAASSPYQQAATAQFEANMRASGKLPADLTPEELALWMAKYRPGG